MESRKDLVWVRWIFPGICHQSFFWHLFCCCIFSVYLMYTISNVGYVYIRIQTSYFDYLLSRDTFELPAYRYFKKNYSYHGEAFIDLVFLR